ncbi:hypothetical protein NLS50_004441 [Escherichia coli]|uniref:hypothetical protein n=2 Tax=Escherichia coli TaxID=562 RepID=UPI00132167D8|nr:hypothetical protein [Escherichia coli]EJK7533733.1 hypothetical protein [Escherichia coli]MWJ95071.1 hypothetical protein [Escherichia coli]
MTQKVESDFAIKTHTAVMEKMVNLNPQSFCDVVEDKMRHLAKAYTDNNRLALGVQLFVRIRRQFPALPVFAVIDIVVDVGGMKGKERDEFVCVLDDMCLLGEGIEQFTAEEMANFQLEDIPVFPNEDRAFEEIAAELKNAKLIGEEK